MLSLIAFRASVRQNVLFTIWCKIVKPCPTNGVSINNYRLDISLVVFVYISLSLSFWLSFVHPCCPVEAMVCLESITARTSLSNWLVIDGSIPPSTPSSAQCTQCTVHTILCTLLYFEQNTGCTVAHPALHNCKVHIAHQHNSIHTTIVWGKHKNYFQNSFLNRRHHPPTHRVHFGLKM